MSIMMVVIKFCASFLAYNSVTYFNQEEQVIYNKSYDEYTANIIVKRNTVAANKVRGMLTENWG